MKLEEKLNIINAKIDLIANNTMIIHPSDVKKYIDLEKAWDDL